MALVQVLGRRRARRGSGATALVTGAVLLTLLLAASFAAGALTGHDPALTDLTARFRPPTAEHWFGTDQLGRDVFARVLVAAGTDLPLALLGAAVPAVIGIVLGALAGYARGWIGTAVMRLADLIQAFPSYILLIVLVFLLGPGAGSFLVGAAVGAWVTYARLVRGVVLRLRELDYVRAAQAAGLGHTRVLLRHVLPNALPQAVVYAASDIVLALSYLAALSYLGLGIQAPGIEWGQMIAEGQPFLRNQWWVSVMPGLAIILVGVAVRLIAGGLERRLQR
ncbi:ABC transporter permease [Herbidospora galbida]|uniref:ABC transporter permease n=1 Tax=Herbidospora galbida TaxID=2575442 RepID=A0A4U3M1M9_9ACTN|nr:ABC transporter permease [Herbidospora galbida]TKK81067.1 ABC transporter permease [Herbidospora galbida]